MKVVLLDKKYFLSEFPVNELGIEWEEYDSTPKDKMLSRLQDADIVLTHGVVFDRETIRQLPKLKMISANSTGYERIDITACREFGITVCNVKDWCTNSVVEHIISFMFSLNRSLPSYHDFVQSGNWKGTPYEMAYKPAKEIRGSVVGIIGYGTLGKHLAEVCKALGIDVLIAEHKHSTDIGQGYTPFDDVIKQSDFIVVQAPLNEQTKHIISYPELEMMKPDAYLINCGRGGLVNETALFEALEQKEIAGAGLDVIEAESFKNAQLLNYVGHNLILSPHIAFTSQQSIANNTMMVAENVKQFINETPINVVS